MDILIVDDNLELAENFAEILEEEGHQIRYFERPEQALVAAQEAPFEVALLDNRMPGMDGVTLFLALRELQPSARYILMTAYTSEQRIAEALEAGVHGVLRKPVPVVVLLSQLGLPPAS